jgi:hypothetical protein
MERIAFVVENVKRSSFGYHLRLNATVRDPLETYFPGRSRSRFGRNHRADGKSCRGDKRISSCHLRSLSRNPGSLTCGRNRWRKPYRMGTLSSSQLSSSSPEIATVLGPHELRAAKSGLPDCAPFRCDILPKRRVGQNGVSAGLLCGGESAIFRLEPLLRACRTMLQPIGCNHRRVKTIC